MSGFAYTIDYAAEIAKDEAEVARLSSELQVTVSAEITPEAEAAHIDPYDFVLATSPEVRAHRAALLGAVEFEAVCFALFCDEGVYDDVKATPEQELAIEAMTNPEFYAVGARFEAAMKVVELSIDMVTEPTRKARLKRAKATLARHKRNQKKHG